MLMLFSISMLGQMLVHRILSVIAQEFAISQHTLRSLMIFNVLLTSVLVSFHSSPVALWLFIGILLISLKFFSPILRFFLMRRLSSALIPMLDSVILGLQSGKSFRISLQAAIENQNGWRRNQMREIYNSLITSEVSTSVKSALLKDLLAELAEIDRSQNRTIDQVRALRRHLKLQENFRRRSGQVTQQIKMQAIIVTALYFALLSFVIAQFGFFEHRKLILASVLIFFTGLFWIFNVGRRMKWKV
ncbi:MAG TPA: hypothetical protein VF412_10280 [Bdellovibrio sp.]|uniref:hypothetical protein n=1 Tax=Bdellovibrio sp. TaxID=28201 RepID=UPI002EFCD09E